MSFIKQISSAIKKPKRCHSHSRMATNFLFVLSLAVIAIGSFVYDATQTQLVEAQSGDWYGVGGAWQYRQKLTIDGTKVVADLPNFPVLISLTSDNLKDTSNGGHVGKSNGGDILFTLESAPTDKLDHEIEKYNATTGELIAWVRCDLSTGTDIVMNMYYGNATATDQWNPDRVWLAHFEMVQHLNDESTTTTKDSTDYGNNGTKLAAGQPTEVVGKIGMAQSFNGNGKISTPLDTAFGDFTVEVWFKDANPASSYERLLDKSYTTGFWLGRNNAVANSWGGGIKEASVPYGIFSTFAGDGTWNYLASVRSGTTHLLYANGALVNQNTVSGTLLDNTAIALGAWSDPGSPQQKLSGSLDEVRVSYTARDAGWIQTSYNSQSDPSAFVSPGTDVEEVYGTNAIEITSPTASTNWKIGDTEIITFSINGIDDPIDHFQIYYSEDSGSNWNLIDDNVEYQNPLPNIGYDWVNIPIVSGPGETNFKIKVEAYDSTSTLLATDESEAFIIDYGPVADWNLEALMNDRPLRGQLAIETPFTLKATAKDQYGNIITNYQGELELSLSNSPTPNSPVITPDNLGGGSGTWTGGNISFTGYEISIADDSVLPLTIQIKTSAPEDHTEDITLTKYGIFIVEPNSDSTWTVGETHNITFKFTGLVPTNPYDPARCFARFLYTQDGSWTTPYTVKDASGLNNLDVVYESGQELITVVGSLPQATNGPIQMKAEFYYDENPADPEVEIITTDISEEFHMGDAMALQGTYISSIYNISSQPNDTFDSFEDMSATYSEDPDGHSNVTFSLRFYNDQDQLLGVSLLKPGGWFVAEGDDFVALMGLLNSSSDPLLVSMRPQIKKIQFRIEMQTENYDLYSPYVEVVELSYNINTAVQIGTFNFDGISSKSVAPGGSTDFDVRIRILNNKDIVDANGIKIDASNVGSGIVGLAAADVEVTAADYNPTEDIYEATVHVTTTIATPPSPLLPEPIPYPIPLSISVNNRPDLGFVPTLITGFLTVTDGTTTPDFSIVWVDSADINKVVQPGGMAQYNFIATWDLNYSPDIILTTNITTVIGTSYIDKVEYYVGSDLVTGNTLVKPLVAPYTKTVQMRVTTKLTGGEKSLTSFTITGTGNSIPKTLTPSPSLTISNQPANAVIVEAKAEVEGGTTIGYTAPTFTIRLYKKGTTTYTEKTGALAVSKDATTNKYTVRASFDKATTDTNGKVVAGTTYIGYLRSIRHFWKKATTPTSGEITIVTGTNSYTLEFPKLYAGDIAPTAPDNEINSLDFQASLTSFGQSLTNALNDFDNNGQINVLDIGFVLTNYFKKGDLLP